MPQDAVPTGTSKPLIVSVPGALIPLAPSTQTSSYSPGWPPALATGQTQHDWLLQTTQFHCGNCTVDEPFVTRTFHVPACPVLYTLATAGFQLCCCSLQIHSPWRSVPWLRLLARPCCTTLPSSLSLLQSCGSPVPIWLLTPHCLLTSFTGKSLSLSTVLRQPPVFIWQTPCCYNTSSVIQQMA